MNGNTRTGTGPKGGKAAGIDSPKRAPIEAFEIGQVAGRPLYLIVGADAEHRITPGLPFSDD